MKHIVKQFLGVITLSVIAFSCSHPLDQKIIDSFTADNIAMIQKLTEAKKSKDDITAGKTKKYPKMLSNIDPKKKAAFDKDKTAQDILKQMDEKYNKAIAELDQNITILTDLLDSNDSFISSLKTDSREEDSIIADWADRTNKTNIVLEKIEQIQNKTVQYLPEYNTIIKVVLDKYGKSEITKKSKH